MKILTNAVRTLAVLMTLFALPHHAFAAKKFNSFTDVPASTNVSAGVATNVSSVFTLSNGTGGSAVGNGSNCFFSFSISPSDPNVTASLSVTNFTSSAVNLTQTTTLTVTFGAAAASNTYTVIVYANANPSNQVNISTITATNTISMASAAPASPLMTWTPAGVNINWSTANNWTPNGPPVSTNDVLFDDLGTAGSAGVVDNTVTSSLTIGSLTYGETNGFHTTQINSGVTLTVGGDVNGLVTGTGTDNGNLATVNTVTGAGGTLAVSNITANVFVSQSHAVSGTTASATLDLSGLDTFKANVARVMVGVDAAIKGASGNLFLAKTNNLTAATGATAPQLDVGENSQANGITGFSCSMLLGQSNGLRFDSIAVGRGRVQLGTVLAFNPAFSSPSATFRGTAGGTNRVSTWSIGDAFTSKGATLHATNDFTLGTVDAMVDTMFVGVGAQATASTVSSGTLLYNAGKFDVNTLQIGSAPSTNSTVGIVSLGGGSLSVNTLLELGSSQAGATNGNGTLSTTSATVTANNGIIAGGGFSAVALVGSTLNATNASATIGTPLSPLSSLAVTNSTLNLPVQLNSPTISVTALAADTAPNTINITAVPLLTGFAAQFPLIQYSTASGDLTTFVLGTLPTAVPPYAAFISNNVANSSIDIVFTGGPSVPALTWDGRPNGSWDLTTTNWRPKTGPNTNYTQSNFVTFNDSLTGTATVNLTTSLVPGSVTVSNSATNTYTFIGTGGIGGNITLIKTNTGTLVLDNNGNTSTGGIIINQGTVQLGNNDGQGTLFPGGVEVDDTLVFKRNDSITVGVAISGAGTLIQNSALQNTLTLTGNNTFTGSAIVTQGTLQLGSSNAIGVASAVTVNSGATLDVDGQTPLANGDSNLVVTVSGAGVGGNGAIVNSATNNLSKVFHTVNLAADATFGGTGNWDVRNSLAKNSPADGQLNGAFNLTKVGSNTVTLNNVILDTGLKNINVQGGTLDIGAGPTTLGDPSFTATVFTNATLTLDTLANTVTKNAVLNGGATLKGSSTNGSGGPVTLAGAVSLPSGSANVSTSSNSFLQINSTISGAGGLTKISGGVVFLGAANSYTGTTTVSGGTLALTNNGVDGSLASTNINVTSGALLDVTGRSDTTLTLASGQTLSGGVGVGVGAINGILLAPAGSFIAPGNTTNTGSLTVSSSATLQGATLMKLNPTNSISDQLAANTLTYGGTLTVSSLPGAYTDGETFQLFVASNGVYNTANFSSVTLPSAPGLTWTNKLQINGTLVAGVVSRPSITNISIVGTSLTISGVNGTAGLGFTIRTSTNVATPVASWTAVTNGTFGGGTFSKSFTVNPTAPQNFYLITIP